MEFRPAVYMEKSFMADSDNDGKYDSFGVFPRDPRSQMEEVDRVRTNNQVWYVREWNEQRGDYQPTPFAEGTKMTFAAEDDDYRIRISCEDGLGLYDGRNRAQNGWYVLRTLIPADKTEIVWHISPDTSSGWVREPNISHSQVGYEPNLNKVAVIELDPNYVGSNSAKLQRLNADGTYTDVFEAELGAAKSWQRYVYKNFDFSEVKDRGTYVINYDGFLSDPFAIDVGVYDHIWQASASNYLAVQMDHMRIREGYKIWRNAAHMDDALQAPKNMSWFDGWSMGGTVDSGYEEYEHIPGLDVGGFCDAGDFDIQIGSNLTLIDKLATAYQVFGNEYDTLDVDWDTHNVELHRPDGTPDLVQLAAHGALQMKAELDNVGFLASVIEVPTLRQYTHLGDGSKDTDNLIYDASLAEDEVEGRRAGKRDDRLAFFTTKSISTNAQAAAAIANSAAILKPYDPEMAADFVKTAEAVWADPELSHEGVETVTEMWGMQITSGPADWNLAIALFAATGKEVYKNRIIECFDAEMKVSEGGGGMGFFFGGGAGFGSDGWKVITVLDQLGDEYKAKYEAALTAYAPQLNTENASNPYGVSDTMGMWGGSDGVVGGATTAAILHKYYPEIVDAAPVFRAVNYILGTHPYNSVSWISTVGYNSVEKGYGSNRADNYYIAGGLVPGYVTIAPDFPEHMDDFNFLWFENEYTAPVTADWVLLAIGADEFARELDEECEHDYQAKVSEPTCTKDGFTTFICSKCFDSYEGDVIPALGHDDQIASVVEPTCTKKGYTNYVCARCGKESVGAETEALGHEYVNGTCIRCGRPENIAWKQASSVEAGKQYVIVDKNNIALVNNGSKITGAEVTIDGDVITSEVADNMVWDFTSGAFTHAGNTGLTGCYVTCGDSGLLARGSGTTLNTSAYADLEALGASKDYYAYWIAQDLGDGTFGLYTGNVSSSSSSTKMYTPQYNASNNTFIAYNAGKSTLDTMLADNALRLFEIVDARDIPGGDDEDDEKPILHPELPIYENPEYTFEERAADLVGRMTLKQKGSQLVEGAAAIPADQLGGGALNVPGTKGLARYSWWAEALHGLLRDNMSPQSEGTKDNVSYAQALTMGSTWNPELYYEGATAIADECRERSIKNDLGNAININFYSPTVNMQRDPRWGRNEESYSEDVYLTSVMATQYVLGMEGKDQDGNSLVEGGYKKTLTTIKHYTANNTEAIRTNGGATSDIRALREYYTAPYRNVIQAADVASVMTAYSSFNSEPCSYSSYLMDTLLRQTFGFSGHITSDCDSAKTISNLNYTNPRTGKKLTAVEQMAGALAHGEDLECNSGISASVGSYSDQIDAMVNSGVQTDKGLFTENSVDVSLHRLMTARISTGELDENNPYTIAANERMAQQKANGTNNYTQERIDIVDKEVKEGTVMLKNDGILPLNVPETGEYKVAIVGTWQTDMYLGLYSSEQRHEEDEKWRINIQEGIVAALKSVNPAIEPDCIVSRTLTAENEETIKNADVAIVVVGTGNRYSAEGRDRSSIVISDSQDTLISQVGKLNPNTVAVMETCGPVQVTKFENDVRAILWSSYGGIRKGIGFGSILIGETNPSGHLTATWFQNDSDMPGIRDYNLYATDGSNGRTYMYYVGENAPSYPFGYGLSYTTFAYSGLKIDKTAYDANDTVKVSFDVTNTGKVEGKEVAQLYIAQPDAPAELNRPIRRLEGFKKINLKPGETQTVSLEVAIPDLAYYNEEKDCYEVDTGKYQVQVGEDSASANLTADFTVSGEMDEYPVLLTVKANQVGDDAQGIEERIIFDRGAVINPQLTVAMNNEKLYGYIIKEQTSVIKSLASCDLPEGMTFSYKSNRSGVAKVVGDKITAVGPGVATITVTGELDGHTVTADFVVYVTVNAKLDGIKVNGEELPKFNADKHAYKMTLEHGAAMPEVEAIAKAGMEVKVEMPEALPGIATITSTDPESGLTETYTVEFKVKAPASAGGYYLVDEIEADKQYVVVATTENGDFAMVNGEAITAAEVDVAGDMILSDVSDEMLWTFMEGESTHAGDRIGYYLTNDDEHVLARGSGGGALYTVETVDSLGTAHDYYGYWMVSDLDEEGNKGLYAGNMGSSWSSAYILSCDGTNFKGTSQRLSGLDDALLNYPIKLYEFIGSAGLPDIDFTNPADASKFEVIGENTAAIAEGEGLALVTTKSGIEPGNNQLSGDAATTPVDMIAVPVAGDWTATLEFVFNTNGARNGYYQFFGMYASAGEDYQNLAGIRGGDGALQNFLRVDGAITADSSDLNSAPGIATDGGTYWYQIKKEGDTYTCLRSADGEEFTEMFTYEDTGIEADQILIDAYTGMTEGYKFTLKSLTFEGGSAGPVVKDKPAIASITVNGEDFGFDPAVKIYNFEVAKDSDKAPVIEAVAANKSTVVEIEQLDGPFGTAIVKGTIDKKSVSYSLSFNYGPQDDYFADGDMSDDWTILHEVKDPTEDRPYTYYRFEEGTGLVLPTQKGSIYMAKQADPKGPWTNVFTMPAQGNWEVVIKSFYPQLPKDIYQQTQVFAWQDEDHYIRINCQYNAQQNLRVEPANEKGSGTFNILDVTYANPNPDGTATLYYKINKNGTTYTVSYSTDCKNWVAGGSVSGLDYVDPKIGIFCTQDDGNDNWIELAFEYVAVTSLNGVEQRNGPEVLAWAAQQAADYMAAGLPAETAENLTVKAPHGYTVEFVSGNSNVIAADGTVTAADKDTEVQVAVKVTEGEITATSELVTIKVPGTGSEEPEEPGDLDEALKAAQAAQKAAEAAKKAAEEAKAAAEEAAKAANADKTAAEAAQAAAEAAQAKADAAQKAAEAAQKAAEASDAEAAKKAAESAASAAESAASAAEAAKAQAAAAQAQAKAEEAQKAAEAAQKKADEAAAKGEAAADEAANAQKAADEAKKAAEDAKNAAAVSAKAAEEANAEAAEAAAKAAENAAKIADAQKQIASAQAEVAELAAKAAKDAADAAAARKAAEEAQKAAEEAAKAAAEAELAAAKYNALTNAALAAAAAENADPAVVQEGLETIEAAKTIDEVEDALKDLFEALGYDVNECPSAKFIDAPAKDNWAHEGIDFCVANDYMNGVSANVFSPAGTVTRAQLVTILYRVAGSPATEFKGTFSDVADGQWYSAAIEWAAANGVVNGIGEGKFAPDGEITREQIATILFRYSKADKVEGDLKAFPDGDTAGDFAVDGLIWAVDQGLITGVKNGDVTNLAPKDNATREQIAAIIMRFLEGSYDCE